MKTLLFLFCSYLAFGQIGNVCYTANDKITDDTATIQACIDNAPDYSTILFMNGLGMKLTATINIHGRSGLQLIGAGGAGGSIEGGQGAKFFWYGVDGGTMFDLDRSDAVIKEDGTLILPDGVSQKEALAALVCYLDHGEHCGELQKAEPKVETK